MFVNIFYPNDKIFFLNRKELNYYNLIPGKIYNVLEVENFNFDNTYKYKKQPINKHYRYQHITILDENNEKIKFSSLDYFLELEISVEEKIKRYKDILWIEAEFDILISLDSLIKSKKDLLDLINNKKSILEQFKSSLDKKILEKDEIAALLEVMDEKRRLNACLTEQEWKKKKIDELIHKIENAPKEIENQDVEIKLYLNVLNDNIEKSRSKWLIKQLSENLNENLTFDFNIIEKLLDDFIQRNINICYENRIFIREQVFYDTIIRKNFNNSYDNSPDNYESEVMNAIRYGNQDKFGL